MNSPAEILQIWIGNSVKKATLPTFKMILLPHHILHSTKIIVCKVREGTRIRVGSRAEL